ncbi:hypothetical protein [Streptomyces sp. NPDC058463]|uniref:hypothetical protein n=1 Tax=Streptomyces sp. NPDC058463 TaxID=3346510 RepID=UPI003663BA22
MARRRPAHVRAGLPPKRPAPHTPVDGLDARAQADVIALERSRLAPGAVARGLRSWRAQVSRPARTVALTDDDTYPCCEDHCGRAVLETALHALPRRSARRLRALVEPLDAAFVSRTIPDPHARPGAAWWQSRM